MVSSKVTRASLTVLACLLILLSWSSQPATADTASFTLAVGNPALPPAPLGYGTIALTLNGSGGVGTTIGVAVTMNPTFQLGNGGSFAFNIVGATAGFSISGLPLGWGFTCCDSSLPSSQEDGFGGFEVNLNAPNGNPGSRVSALALTVSRTAGFTTVNDIVELSSLPAGGGRGNFAGHVFATLGTSQDGTTNCAVTTCTGFARDGVPVPEPGTLSLLGTGLVGVGGVLGTRLFNRGRKKVV